MKIEVEFGAGGTGMTTGTFFSRAAADYDSVAGLQRDVGAQLLTRLDDYAGDPRVILDLGSGTGFFAEGLRERFARAQ